MIYVVLVGHAVRWSTENVQSKQRSAIKRAAYVDVDEEFMNVKKAMVQRKQSTSAPLKRTRDAQAAQCAAAGSAAADKA